MNPHTTPQGVRRFGEKQSSCACCQRAAGAQIRQTIGMLCAFQNPNLAYHINQPVPYAGAHAKGVCRLLQCHGGVFGRRRPVHAHSNAYHTCRLVYNEFGRLTFRSLFQQLHFCFDLQNKFDTWPAASCCPDSHQTVTLTGREYELHVPPWSVG